MKKPAPTRVRDGLNEEVSFSEGNMTKNNGKSKTQRAIDLVINGLQADRRVREASL